jgi:branched-chain amino acid transport system permease protein
LKALIILCAAFAVAPFLLTGSYTLGILLLAMLTVVTAVGLDLVVGYAGQYSFAQGAFTGLGAYTAAILERDWDASFWLQLPAGIAVAGLSGLLLGMPALRLRGHFLAIVTIAFQTIVVLVLAQWTSFTGGPYGLTLNDIPGFTGTIRLYWLSFAVMVAGLLVAYALAQSRLGLAWRAIGDDEVLARGIGLHTTAAKLAAFSTSAALAGAAGVVAGHYIGNITPDGYSLAVSATVLAMVVVGGRGTLAGPAFAAAALTALPEFLRPLHDVRLIVYGLLLVVCMCLLPTGIAGLLRRRPA